MKKCPFVFLLLIGLNCVGQNIGIGNSNPAEKLDVSGNINVTGTIKANGVDGTANQVLMKNNSGVLEWEHGFSMMIMMNTGQLFSFSFPLCSLS